jgi:uncharacterized damage-inducible protein DinB
MNLYGTAQLADSMRTVRQNTIAIAEDIPEEKYSYRPTPESRSVRETLLHILVSAQAAQRMHGEQRIASFENVDFPSLLEGLPVKEKDQRSKQEIIALLRSEGDRWSQWVEQIPESVLAEPVSMRGSGPATKNRFELLLGTKEHEMHHRAQLMVIERLLGIVPHLSRRRPPVRETAVR